MADHVFTTKDYTVETVPL